MWISSKRESSALLTTFTPNTLPLPLLSLRHPDTLVVVFYCIKRNTHSPQHLPHKTLSGLHAYPLSTRFSLGHNSPHTPPKVAPCPPASFPRIRIDELKAVSKAGFFKLGDVRHIKSQSRGLKRRAATLIQIKLIRPCRAPRRPVRCWICRCRIVSVCDLGRYGRVASCNEITPDSHECLVESRALVRGG